MDDLAQEARANSDPGEAVDVEAIMRDIRRSVEEKRQANVYPKDASWPRQPQLVHLQDSGSSVEEHLEALRASAGIQIEGEPITSHRPFLGYFIKSFKNFWRYWTRKYTDTLFLRQSYYNSEVTATLAALNKEINQLRSEIETLRENPPDRTDSKS